MRRPQRPGWDAARVAAYLLSGLLLLLPLLCLLVGVALLVFYRPLWLFIPLALIAFAIAGLFRPRAHRLPTDTLLVRRDEAPALFGLLDEIAAAIGTPPVPQREIDRRLRVSRLRETRTDSSHPPMYLRTKLIRTRPATSARVVLGLNENRAIDRELAPAAEAALKELRAELPR